MDALLREKLLAVAAEAERVQRELATPEIATDPARCARLARKNRELAEIVSAFREYEQAEASWREADRVLRDTEDVEWRELAREEARAAETRMAALEARLKALMIPRDPNDERCAIMEIRAGTGGEEAALFAADLFRMYSRFAERRGWSIEVLNSNPTGLGGFKEISFRIAGDQVFSQMKWEGGVHRVQRVPDTESQGRIHTSAVTVAVLPEAEEVDVAISPDDLEIDVYRSSGAGGQHVNTTDSAVRITHKPTGIVVTCQDERSQHKNKARALMILRSRLLEAKIQEENAARAAQRKFQVRSGDRSEKIRTYNFPENRVTDHRIQLSLYKLRQVLDGDLQELIDALAAADRAARLVELEA
ncbi:MAG TPA: peptide chain release factor 1 [Candidatus Hydrogenedentes bacterium]|nr:peptide chain release factor 1 [Candidatus Hydrogenedentota bacterium]